VADSSIPAQVFAETARRCPDRPFAQAPASARLPWAPDGFAITYGQAAAQVNALQADYVAAGYGLGSRVALLLQNRPETLLHWIALNGIGASIVPLNGDMRPDELMHQMVVSQAAAVIAAPGFGPLLEAGLPDGVAVAALGGPPPPARQRMRPGAGRADTEAALLFTSGSTGKPKACILSNAYFLHLADWYVSMPGAGAMQPDAEVALTPLPFFHMNALGCTALGMMRIGGAIVPLDRFHPDRWWATIADSGATIVHALGVIPAIVLQRPASPDDRRHRARFVFAPGVDAAQRAAFEARYGVTVVDGWAMTETGGGGITDTAGLSAIPAGRCIGRPRDGMEWRIVDAAGQDVATGQAGELLVRSAGPDPRRGFFSGYLGDDSATQQAWDGGWFHTGDVMRADADGLLYFLDRRKSIIRRSGENISALEVEAALLADPAIRSAAVTPVSDALREEEVFAFVVTREGTQAGAILDRLAQRLSYHKLPGWMMLTDELPVSSTQKLQRGTLRALAETAVAEARALDLRRTKGALRTAKEAS
jgi:acyl-coenzyme A synthetase/AMP-(fatty) acid ligase